MSRTKLAHALVTLAAIASVGCGRNPDLSPAPGAQLVSAPGEAAIAEAGGVRLTAQVQAWDADPENLQDVMTPIRVEIFNGSNEPIRVRNQEFQLVTTEKRLAAIAPYNIDEEVAQRVDLPYYAYDPFYHPYYYDDYDIVHIELPTDQMIQFALPEGVIEPGQSAAGFIYFEDIDQDETRARLEMDLVNAGTGAPFGRIQIPFMVH